LGELTQWASDALEQCGQAQYSVAGREIGTLLTSLQAHVATATGSDRDRAFTGVVTACFSAGVVASRTGNIDLAVAAARRGVDLARRHDNPGLIGFACWYWALELTSVAARARATGTLGSMGPQRRQPPRRGGRHDAPATGTGCRPRAPGR
jgi:hypothetical protein